MTNPSNWLRLVYASRANFVAGADNASVNADMARILMQSRKNNPANGLVGALYFADGCFSSVSRGPLMRWMRCMQDCIRIRGMAI